MPMGLSASVNEPAAIFASRRRRIRLCGVVTVVSSFRYYFSVSRKSRRIRFFFFSSELLWLTDRMRPSSGKEKKN
jgi:hypothetical protein